MPRSASLRTTYSLRSNAMSSLIFAIARDKHLADNWFGSAGRLAKRRVGGRNGAPTEQAMAFVLDDLFEELLALVRVRT